MNQSQLIRTAAMPVLAAALILFNSCAGYEVGNVTGAEMRGVKTVYVPTVKNNTFEPRLQTMTTNALLRRIDNDGTFSSSRQRNANATLEVLITRVDRRPLRSQRSDVDITAQYEIIMEAEVTLVNHLSGRKVLDQRIVKGKTTYFIQEDMQEAERQALPMAADDLAYNTVKLMSEGW